MGVQDVDGIKNHDIFQLRAFTKFNVPLVVEKVFHLIVTILEPESSDDYIWDIAKKMLNNNNFRDRLTAFDFKSLKPEITKTIETILNNYNYDTANMK